jgi:hypothetical protein
MEPSGKAVSCSALILIKVSLRIQQSGMINNKKI